MQEIREKWQQILDITKTEFGFNQVSFNNWLAPLKPYSIQNNVLYVLVPQENETILGYMQKTYAQPLRVSILEVTGKDYKVTLTVESHLPSIQSESSEDILSHSNKEETKYADLNLNPNYTFDTFVVGSNNRFAHSASLAVAESPGEVYNPLLLYGGVGLGKTHLMQSIAHFIKGSNPGSVVRYVSSETFTNELIEAIRNSNANALTKFREKYRNIDVLLIDDIQFIIGKESTQEEFFHTFNELHTAKKQIIISSDKPPKDMQILEDRIRTRLEWGLLADIGAPDYETRMAILKRKEEADGFHLDEEILKYIASNITSNIRELEGALNKLQAYSRLENKEINMDVAVQELQNIISPNNTKEVTPDYVIETVCDHFHVTREEINSSKRSNEIAYPRQIAMFDKLPKLTFHNLGNLSNVVSQ